MLPGALLVVGTANSTIGGGAGVAATAEIADRAMRTPARSGATRRVCNSLFIYVLPIDQVVDLANGAILNHEVV